MADFTSIAAVPLDLAVEGFWIVVALPTGAIIGNCRNDGTTVIWKGPDKVRSLRLLQAALRQLELEVGR